MNSYTLIVLSFAFLLGTSVEQCGRQARNGLCLNGLCSSQHGWCGTKLAYYGAGCQSQCRPSTTPSNPTAEDSTPTMLSSLLPDLSVASAQRVMLTPIRGSLQLSWLKPLMRL
ncbi:hypothetical protein FH972_024832 [Carpinus fangiana]|uniref:Chitin-binding type-1 domain-containing protein n=1 Tax=Carpinus fangiana TaxID=176857 RepID=A0A5N6KZL1_9ROSI|nr:hypothetical protein FH972_024832 [Carpinus fangiana]